MKAKVIVVVLVIALLGLAVGGYFYYELHLRFQDDYTDCPVKAFRSKVTSPADVDAFANEATYGSLTNTEKCSLDCKKGNGMACAVYGLAMQAGVFILKDEMASKTFYNQACEKGMTIGCALSKRVDEIAANRAQAKEQAAAKEAMAAKMAELQEAMSGAALRRQQALEYFNGNPAPMMTPPMTRWYEDTCRYLLYDKPLLARMHQVPGSQPKDLDLKAFVNAKYRNGPEGLKLDLMKAFFDKFKRLGVMQIRLDHYVEKKKESEIPKTHKYFKGKHTFLYRVAEVELEIFGGIAQEVKADQMPADPTES